MIDSFRWGNIPAMPSPTIDPKEGVKLLTEQIKAGEKVLKLKIIHRTDYSPWSLAVRRVVIECMGEDSPEAKRLELAPLELRKLPPNATEEDYQKARPAWVEERISILRSCLEKLKLALKPAQSRKRVPTKKKQGPSEEVSLTWLHISDFHFRESRSWQQDSVLQALMRDVVSTLPADGLTPDLVFATGDIAQSGKAAEYVHASAFFSELSTSLGVTSDRWFIVPGNHDVNRTLVSPITKRAVLADHDAVNECLEHEDSRKQYAIRQKDFFKFTSEFLGSTRALTEESPWRVDSIDVKGLKLAVLSLNSAWASYKDHEDSQLFLGEYQVVSTLRQAAEHRPDLMIALMHHPVSWLKEFDEHKSEALLRGAGGVQFLLRGHLHNGRIKQESNPDAISLEIASGACWQDSQYPHGVTVVRLYPRSGYGEVHLWRYSAEGRGHWKRDNFLYENFRDGTWRFPIPACWGLKSDVEPRREATKPATSIASPKEN